MTASHDALPVREEPRQHRLIDRLRFLAQFRERAAADRAEDFVVAPLALRSARTELAFDEAATLDEPFEGEGDDGDAESVTVRDVVRREWTVRAREAEDEIADRVGDRLEIALGD